ncbi:conserved Plasmodium protein, unknown function [Plasmodium gallinaceum]|uniref:Uncharacterized protein n=1 Tax=Plasmodium gallinaceum TaxID=5849 RepID=A0A1J1GX05_PLAGA|nr:conserved Plasmodium protein, unknown function [Plasmodium gallinaceum]CRG97081.1 conserved Plasmodium protein, unknown function [Plasmodium gallinaceum]
MIEDKQINVKIDSEIKYNRRHKGKKKNLENNDCHNELYKYKRSLHLIKKAIKLIKNHYYNKINKVDTLRIRQKKKLFYFKKENIILEDKCTFYSEHVEELKKIYTDQLNMKNDRIQNLQEKIDKMNGSYDNKCESNLIRILKLREDQIERLSQQLNTINNLYHKQVDNNKKLIEEIEDLNKSILYLNNKVLEEKKNTEDIKKKFKFYRKYNRNRKKFKLNFEIINHQGEKQKVKENDDICLSILCLLKTELETIDDENKKKKVKEEDQKGFKIKNNNFFKKLLESNHRYKKSNIFDNIYKKQFFTFYEDKFTENYKVNFENKKIFSFPLNYKKKLNKYSNMYNSEKKNIEKTDNKNKENLNKGDTWNYLSLSDIYFYNNFNENFDNNSEYFIRKREKCYKNCKEKYNKNNYEYNDKTNSIHDYMKHNDYDKINNNKCDNKRKKDKNNKKDNKYNKYKNKSNINYDNVNSSEYIYINDSKNNDDKSNNENNPNQNYIEYNDISNNINNNDKYNNNENNNENYNKYNNENNNENNNEKNNKNNNENNNKYNDVSNNKNTVDK